MSKLYKICQRRSAEDGKDKDRRPNPVTGYCYRIVQYDLGRTAKRPADSSKKSGFGPLATFDELDSAIAYILHDWGQPLGNRSRIENIAATYRIFECDEFVCSSDRDLWTNEHFRMKARELPAGTVLVDEIKLSREIPVEVWFENLKTRWSN